jgi:hypothetical protein
LYRFINRKKKLYFFRCFLLINWWTLKIDGCLNWKLLILITIKIPFQFSEKLRFSWESYCLENERVFNSNLEFSFRNYSFKSLFGFYFWLKANYISWHEITSEEKISVRFKRGLGCFRLRVRFLMRHSEFPFQPFFWNITKMWNIKFIVMILMINFSVVLLFVLYN